MTPKQSPVKLNDGIIHSISNIQGHWETLLLEKHGDKWGKKMLNIICFQSQVLRFLS